MSIKLGEKYDFDVFDPLPEGWYILKVMDGEGKLKDNGGFAGKIQTQVEGGESDGRIHFENFSTKKNDGGENELGCTALLAFLRKSGAAKEGQFTDSSQFENQKFADGFFKNVANKLYGAYLVQEKGTYKGKDTVNTKSKKYRTVAEAQAEMKGHTTKTPQPDGKTAAAEPKQADW